MKNSQRTRKPNFGVFHVSCWVLGLVAFVQMMAVGVAMAFRNQRVPEPEERIVKEYVVIPNKRQPIAVKPQAPVPEAVPSSLKDEEDLVPDLEPVADVSENEILNEPPVILDPVIEKLVEEAHQARIGGDLYLSYTKLNEALLHEPKNPTVLYHLGVNKQAFGLFDEAAQYFLQVYQAGPMKAGSLYEKAAIKLAHGLVPEVDGLAMLGWGRMTTPTRFEGGEKRTLILPVNVSLGKDFDPKLLRPSVRFFEEVDGQVVPAMIQEGGDDNGSEWVTGLADWKDGEEMAEVWYHVPDQDPATGLLFGERKFYGFVAELYYGNRLVDVRAQPRTLLREGGTQSTMDELRRELDELDGLSLEDLAGSSLLPKKSE